MDVYEQCPRLMGDRFLLRLVEDRDAADLLRVYSDPLALPLFNGDNCNGDDFHYQTEARMAQAIGFWRQAYAWRAFVRWAIEDQRTGEAIGTMELFHRDAADDYDGCGLLRLDLRSDHERRDTMEAILRMIVPSAFDWFHCDRLMTKGFPHGVERRAALRSLGFMPGAPPMIGQDGTAYPDYWTLSR